MSRQRSDTPLRAGATHLGIRASAVATLVLRTDSRTDEQAYHGGLASVNVSWLVWSSHTTGRFNDRSLDRMGYSLHGQDPHLFTGMLADRAAKTSSDEAPGQTNTVCRSADNGCGTDAARLACRSCDQGPVIWRRRPVTLTRKPALGRHGSTIGGWSFGRAGPG